MKIIPSSRRHHYLARVNIFLVAVALVAGMAGCDGYTPPSEDLQICDWYDLDAVRNNLAGNHILMNDLDSTTAGYMELASETANGGKGWQPIGTFAGSFDGQGYEIRDLYGAGLFGRVFPRGVIKDVGLVNVTVTSEWNVGSLVGENWGTVSNCYSSGNVTGDSRVGGLVGDNWYYRGILSNSYSTGSVTGSTQVGGLVGYNKATVSNSFWDRLTSGMEESDGGVGKTTAEMMDIATFIDTKTQGLDEPWDIIAVTPGEINLIPTWNIVVGQTYPFLSWQSAA